MVRSPVSRIKNQPTTAGMTATPMVY